MQSKNSHDTNSAGTTVLHEVSGPESIKTLAERQNTQFLKERLEWARQERMEVQRQLVKAGARYDHNAVMADATQRAIMNILYDAGITTPDEYEALREEHHLDILSNEISPKVREMAKDQLAAAKR